MGMITLLIEDTNDNIPVPDDRVLVLCEEEGKRGSVTVMAHDPDLLPYSSPYDFQLSGESPKKWRLRDAQSEYNEINTWFTEFLQLTFNAFEMIVQART